MGFKIEVIVDYYHKNLFLGYVLMMGNLDNFLEDFNKFHLNLTFSDEKS